MLYTQAAIDHAIAEIKDLIVMEAGKLIEEGYSFKASDSAPEGFKALQASLMPMTHDYSLHGYQEGYLNGQYRAAKVAAEPVQVTIKSGKRVMPVADYGSNSSIYGKDVNTLFRFWHDMLHLKHDLGFNEVDEYAVADLHKEAGIKAGLSNLALSILSFDTRGQVAYYFRHKEFIDNQEAFIHSCIKKGMSVAVRCKH